MKSDRARVARGRMWVKAKLGWLSGFPLRQSDGRIVWLALPRFGDRLPQEMVLTRRDLHQAYRTWQKLTEEYPKALPQFVKDSDHWQSAVPRLLSTLDGAINQGLTLPQSLFVAPGFYKSQPSRIAEALATERPKLRPWLAALSWYAFLYPSEAKEALAWSRQHANEVETILAHNDGLSGIVLTQQLWSLTARDGADLVAPLRRLLGKPLVYTTPSGGARKFSERLTQLLKEKASGVSKRTFPPWPETSIGSTLVSFLRVLVGRRRQERRNALSLFGLVWVDEMLPAWAVWWMETERQLRRAKEVIKLQDQSAVHDESKLLRGKLHTGREQLPPLLYLEFTLRLIRLAAKESVLCDELIRILPLIPRVEEGALMRAALFTHWASLIPKHRRQLPFLLRCIRQSWERVGSRPGIFMPWMVLVAAWRKGRFSHRWRYIERLFLENVPEQRLWPVICDTLAANAGVNLRLEKGKGQVGDEYEAEVIDEAALVWLARLTEDAGQATSLVASLAAVRLKYTYLWSELLSLAYHLDGGRENFGRLVARLQPYPSQYVDLRLAADRLDGGGWPGLAADLILSGHVKRLAQIGLRLGLLAQFGLVVSPPSSLPPIEETPSWIKPYPQRLHPVLRLLDSLHPSGQEVARRVLKKNYPDKSRLQTEITVLRRKLSENPNQPKLAGRLVNLERRLTSPRPVSDQRVANLEEKLVDLVNQQAMVAWEEEIDAVLRPALAKAVMVDDLPDWMLDPRQLVVIANLLQLPAEFLLLGLRLLRLRCGPPPWSLIDDPANKQFITAMERRGVRMESWLNPPAPREFTGDNGRQVIVEFETDPLEIFQMGSHFNTCLSPGIFNFFSVFTNAADINKHVLYARDEEQQVVGRCLIALTEEGSLLTFFPYCHDPGLGFHNIVAKVVTNLVAQMGVPIHLRGRVPALVAPSWYDDGPHDVTGRFEFLDNGSEFRKALVDMTPKAFLQEVETLFAPLPLNALSLMLIMALPELKEQPALVLPLIPYLEAEKSLPDYTIREAVKLAHRAGEKDYVRKVMQSWAPAYLQRIHRLQYPIDPDLVMILVELDPSAGLRFLRSSRPHGVRRDEEEEGWRLEALAEAHENLARYVLAQKLRAKLST